MVKHVYIIKINISGMQLLVIWGQSTKQLKEQVFSCRGLLFKMKRWCEEVAICILDLCGFQLCKKKTSSLMRGNVDLKNVIQEKASSLWNEKNINDGKFIKENQIFYVLSWRTMKIQHRDVTKMSWKNMTSYHFRLRSQVEHKARIYSFYIVSSFRFGINEY